jgi:DNA primase
MTYEADSIGDLMENFDMEAYLDWQGLTYRRTRGSSGNQLNLKTCPFCGGSKWKVYIGTDEGHTAGNCNSGSCGVRFGYWSFVRANLGDVATTEVARHIKQFVSGLGWKPKEKIKISVVENGDLVMPDSVSIPHNGSNAKYLAKRGITSETASYFNLRYCTSGGFRYELNGKKLIQDYSSRIIIPIYDLDGVLVSFQGRDVTGEHDKKVLFPPGFASTGKYFLNAHNAHFSSEVVIGEGAFDAMSLKQALEMDSRFASVVALASFGKNISMGNENDQLTQLFQLKAKRLKKITIFWDGERKATKAAVDAALKLKSFGFKVNVVLPPKDLDPNEMTPEQICYHYANSVEVTKASALSILTKLSQY